MRKFASLFVFFILNSLFLILVSPVSAQTSFRFIAWGDTKSDITVLKNLSVQAKPLNPKFTIYAGDLESAGFTQSGMDNWKNSADGGVSNGMFNITFPVRGNHDSSNPSAWQGFFNIASQVQSVGATNYNFLNDELTYSFDYGNSRFIGIDVLGDVTSMSSTQINWLDQRLTDAETKGLTHAFFFWHGPFYSEANHCCPNPPQSLVSVLNKHPVISAGFFGHEHILTYTHINSSRVAGVTREFEQIISGDAGAGPTTPTSGRYDYSLNPGNAGGFVTVDVSGNSYTLNFYKGGTTASQYSKTITKGTSPPPASPTTPISNTPPAGGKPGDANGDSRVDGLDYVIWRNHYNELATGAALGDFNNNGLVDGLDYVIWRNNYNR